MNSTEPVLEGRDIVKLYNDDDPDKETVTALDGVSCEIPENEFTVVVGPSGCGKTTLLHIFAGLTPPTRGQALCYGDSIDSPSTDRAVVFQQFNLFSWRTVRENVGFGLEMEGVPDDERKRTVDTFVDLVGLGGFEDSYPGELSGGMQQRVGLARALAVDPSVLLMDEPFGALDAQTRAVMQEELLQIWEKNRVTILFITHDIDEAILLGDRILVMGIDPSDIREEFEVPFERPRYDRDIESTPRFSDLKNRIWNTLREDVSIEA